MPKIVEQNGRHALLVDGQPFFMFAGQINNSSAWPSQLPEVWRAVETIHANTVEMPVYWEQIEPAQGKFDFSVVDTLLKEARQHNVRLVLLWFATWKNGSAHYLPEWMKLEAGVKYPNITGRNGRPVDSPSPHTQAAMELDAKAFAAFMGHLKQADPEHTVLMVQVENESGAWGSVRDFSPAAQKIFESPVPAEMLQPELLKELKKQAPAAAGANWQTVFGDDADEFFQAYWVAHYVGAGGGGGQGGLSAAAVCQRGAARPLEQSQGRHLRKRRPDGQRDPDLENGRPGAGPGRAGHLPFRQPAPAQDPRPLRPAGQSPDDTRRSARAWSSGGCSLR